MDKIMVYPKKDNNCRFGANSAPTGGIDIPSFSCN